MKSIPAASTKGMDLDRIRKLHPEALPEIERIGQLLNSGNETGQDLLQLCELLYKVGERDKAGELLLPNATEGDLLHQLYQRLFGEASNETYQTALKRFCGEFGVNLKRLRSARLLSSVFDCCQTSEQTKTRCDLDDLLSDHCQAQITYEPDGRIVADVYVVEPHGHSSGSADRSVSLHFEKNSWVIDSAAAPTSSSEK